MIRASAFALGCLWMFASASPGRADQPLTRQEAVKAFRLAVSFFHHEVSTHGGYVFRVSSDLSLREGEVKVGNSTAWLEPPATPAVGQAYLDAYLITGEPTGLDAAKATASALIQGQLLSGGWFESIEFADDDRKEYAYRVDAAEVGKRRNVTTFDDDKTQSAIRFLMRLDDTIEQGDVVLREAVMYSLQGVLDSQYSNGAWPQRYDGTQEVSNVASIRASYPETWSREFPNVKYSSLYTLNDGAHCDLITTLIEAHEIYGDPRYLASAVQGGDFLLAAQMPLPQPGWAQQYDRNMQPAWARKFEPPAITGGESQDVMRVLLKLYRRTADPRYLDAVKLALKYYQTCLRPDGRLARFYELETNRPLYMTRRYELTYSDADVPTHYGFVVESSLDRIAQELDEAQRLAPDKLWKSSKLKPPKPSTKFAKEAAKVVAALDTRGAWVESGTMKTHAQTGVQEIIDSKTFIRNLKTLAMFIASTPE